MRSITQCLCGKFHSLNDISWGLEQGVSSRANLTLLRTKKGPKHLQTSADTHTHTHTHAHTHLQSQELYFSFIINGSLFSTTNHLIIRQLQSHVTVKAEESIHSEPGWAPVIPLPLEYFQRLFYGRCPWTECVTAVCCCVRIIAWLPAEMLIW